MSLVGKFVHVNNGEYYKTGEIMEAVTEELFLVKFDPVNIPAEIPDMGLFHASQMVDTHEGIRDWSFYNTRQELDAWLKWLDTPTKSQVVKLVKKE